MYNYYLCSDNSSWQHFLTSPDFVIGFFAIIANLIIFYFNYKLTFSVIQNERLYKSDFTFYELLVLKDCKDLIALSSESKKIFRELRKANGAATDSTTYPKIFQDSADALGRKYDQIEIDVLPSLSGFSNQLGKETAKLLDDYYSNVLDLFSKFANSKPTAASIVLIDKKFSTAHEIFIKGIMKSLKKACPGTKHE